MSWHLIHDILKLHHLVTILTLRHTEGCHGKFCNFTCEIKVPFLYFHKVRNLFG